MSSYRAFPIRDLTIAPYIPGVGYGEPVVYSSTTTHGDGGPPVEIEAEYKITQGEQPVKTDPYLPKESAVDHIEEARQARNVDGMNAPLRSPLPDGMKHRRAGITKNKGRKRDRARAKMARQSRQRNRK